MRTKYTAPSPDPASMRYDAIAKDVFEKDRPALLERVTGGKAIQASLNVEYAMVEERRSDLLYLLEDGTMRLLDIQGSNDRKMHYRAGVYSLMSGEKYGREVWVTVLYIGDAPMRMKDYLKCGGTTVKYDLIDIREIDFDTLMAGGPGDWALAILAKGGVERLGEILARARTLRGAGRERLIVQIGVFAGLRRARRQFKMELKKMPAYIDINKNVFLNEVQQIGVAKGRLELLSRLLERKFGKLPKWAALQLKNAATEEVAAWGDRVLTARTLEAALGRK